MWKNKKFINSIKEVYAEYLVEGFNVETFLNKLEKEEVELKWVKKTKNKGCKVSVKLKDEQKFFAISKKLCYNVKKIKNRGKLLWLYNLLISPGIIVGCLLFIAISVFVNDLVLGFTFVGNGKVYSEQVTKYLNENGITQMRRFSQIDLKKVSNKILADNENFSFVSCQKVGNRIRIELVLAENKTHVNLNNNKDLICSVDGVVDKIYLYRGTSLVGEGDEVKKGDVLVAGYAEIRENRVEVNALAVVIVKIEESYTYILQGEFEEENAKLLALNEKEYGQDELEVKSILKQKINDKYYYKVDVEYKISLYTG